MKEKVLFFDIDGTIVDNTYGVYEVPESVKKELKRIQNDGHKLFICSGRPKAMINQQFLDLGFDGYVLYNGGYIEIDGESIFEERMDTELATQTVDMLEELNCDYMIETAHHIYIDKRYKELYTFFKNLGMEEMFSMDFDRDDVLKRAIKIEANVTNKDKQKVSDYLDGKFGTTISFDQHGSDNSFEFFSPTMSKAIGIKKVLEYYGLDIKDTYAFGDGLNDIEMIQLCQIGVAMGNAVDELKAQADIICKSIDKNGLEDILKALFPQ